MEVRRSAGTVTLTSPGSSTWCTTCRQPARWSPSWRTARCTSQQSGEGEIRRNLVEADLVECIVALPSQLFYTAQIPVCLWFLTRDKSGKARRIGGSVSPRRPRFNEVLFIDARNLGHMVSRTNRELADSDIARIADTYHAWRGEDSDLKPYEDVPGFCASVTLEIIRDHQHVLTPGRYVGSAAVEDDGEPLDEKIARLTAEIRDGFAKRAGLRRGSSQLSTPSGLLAMCDPWSPVALRDVAAPGGLVGGPFGSNLGRRDYKTSGVPVIRGQNLADGRYVSFDDCVYVSESKVERDLSRNTTQAGDLVFTQRGTLGKSLSCRVSLTLPSCRRVKCAFALTASGPIPGSCTTARPHRSSCSNSATTPSSRAFLTST